MAYSPAELSKNNWSSVEFGWMDNAGLSEIMDFDAREEGDDDAVDDKDFGFLVVVGAVAEVCSSGVLFGDDNFMIFLTGVWKGSGETGSVKGR